MIITLLAVSILTLLPFTFTTLLAPLEFSISVSGRTRPATFTFIVSVGWKKDGFNSEIFTFTFVINLEQAAFMYALTAQ